MSRATIEKTIFIEPHLVDKNYKDNIFNRLKSDLVGKCEQKSGYILKIYDGLEIAKNIVSADGSGVFFTVRFNAKVLLPEINKEYKSVVTLITPEGIMVLIDEIVQVFIPKDKMNNYKYNKDCFVKQNKNIKLKSEVIVVINMVKFEQKNFMCLGSLVEE